MGRSTKVVAFSVPAAVARDIERTARDEQKTKSELFRDMWTAYRVARETETFRKIQRSARRSTRAAGIVIRTEEDVDRVLHGR
jgi:hypothetical protein